MSQSQQDKPLWKTILNAFLEVLKGLKNAGLFKRGQSVDDLNPRMRDRREGK